MFSLRNVDTQHYRHKRHIEVTLLLLQMLHRWTLAVHQMIAQNLKMTKIFVEVVVEGREVHAIWSNQDSYDYELYEIGDGRLFCSPHGTSKRLEEHLEVLQEEMRRKMTSVLIPSSGHPGKVAMAHLFVK